MKKGFTLVELLAIILIVALISTLAIVNIEKKSSSYANISNEKLKEIITSATYSYIISNDNILNKVKSSTSGYKVKLSTLVDQDYISDDNLKNIETREDIDADSVTILVKYGLNEEKTSYEYTYEITGID